MKMTPLHILFAFLLVCGCLGNLVIVPSGAERHDALTLPDGVEFCPTSFSANGFSVECQMDGVASVSFWVNREKYSDDYDFPFFVDGDESGSVYSWASHPWGETFIECIGDNGNYLASRIIIQCGDAAEDPQAPTSDEGSDPVAGEENTESADEDEPEEKEEEEVVGPTFAVNEHPSQEYCVTKKASEFMGELPEHWTVEEDGEGLTYRAGDDSHFTQGPGTDVLRYNFTVPIEHTYAVVVEMTTAHPVDFNDVWLKCEGGLNLQFNDTTVIEDNKYFIKAYHNFNGRAKKSFSVDFEPHAISTSEVYKPGVSYTCDIGARSSQLTVNSLILFPCHGETCNEYSGNWQYYLSLCDAY